MCRLNCIAFASHYIVCVPFLVVSARFPPSPLTVAFACHSLPQEINVLLYCHLLYCIRNVNEQSNQKIDRDKKDIKTKKSSTSNRISSNIIEYYRIESNIIYFNKPRLIIGGKRRMPYHSNVR
jgi:hypothetical protein